MDAELIFWMIVFVGGYSLVVGFLLRIVLFDKGSRSRSPRSPEAR